MSTRAGQEHDPRIAIKMGRQYRRQTQTELAKALERETGERWSRGMVAHLESGHKTLTVDTLMAISRIQGLPYAFYLEGPNNAKGVSRSSLLAVPA